MQSISNQQFITTVPLITTVFYFFPVFFSGEEND